ncbi:MAG: YceI family protein [Phototrophicaceae bacterium]
MNNASRNFVTIIVSLVVGAAVGIFAFNWFVGGAGEPSATIVAPTLDVNALPTLNPTEAFDALTQVAELNAQVTTLEEAADAHMVDAAATADALNAQLATLEEEADAQIAKLEETLVALQSTATPAPTNTAEPTATNTEEPTSTPTEEPTATVEPTVEGLTGRRLYRINAAESSVRFELDEDLRGDRITVVGTTKEVAGDIVLDFDNPAVSQLGTIRINARTLETDNPNRNRALRSRILMSAEDEFEFIDFTPTELMGLPEAIVVGETYTFEVVGDLPLIGTTLPATFSVEATLTSDTTLTGVATATINWADWGINIPEVPGVANIEEEATLIIEFVADFTE